MSIDLQQAHAAYLDYFGFSPEVVVRAPGRVNIIGEHTDYNQGFVLPIALERETMILARRRPDTQLHAYAHNLDRQVQLNMAETRRHPHEPWVDYIIGVADQLMKAHLPVTAADLMIIGDVPLGCGLSSSAALEMAAVKLFEALGNFEMTGEEAAKLGQRVENEFLGLNSGIMDQFISRLGRAGTALYLDCRSLEFEYVPIAFADATFVIANTRMPRGLTSSSYNERVGECQAAVRVLQQELGREEHYLRDYTLDDLAKAKEAMPEVGYRRARHVITENLRTMEAAKALAAGDGKRVGLLMNESDASLNQDYEVGSLELLAMTNAARDIKGCFGARMTGAGFGGCTLNLVHKDAVSVFATELLSCYEAATTHSGEILISGAGTGASRLL